MRKNILQQLKACFLDQMTPTITYLIGVFLVVSFYAISTDRSIEIIYPLTLAVVVYLIYFLIAFIRFMSFCKALNAMAEHQDVDVVTHSVCEAMVKQKIYQIHSQYSSQIHKMEMKSQEESRFLSTWVHNMKTPVSVNNLILQRYQLNQISREELILGFSEENEKLNRQLDMVLNLFRVNEFEKDYLPAPVNLTESLNRIINQNQKQFIYNRVFPKMNQPDRDLIVLSDAKWNNLVISQLISNGIKYSKPLEGEEAGKMEFTMEQKEGKVTLVIRDFGKGIPEYDLPRVYEPFFTGDNGRNTKGASGIGLYFCKEVCRMLGHELNITSIVGEGTTVTLTYLAKL